MMWTIERHYLRTWGSSFAENFYGLRRRRRPGIATPRAKTASSARTTQQAMEALRPIDIYVSLFTLVGLPYLQTKLHDLWEREGGGVDAEQGGLFGDDEEQGESGPVRRAFIEEETGRAARLNKMKTLLKVCFRKGYPYIGTAWQLWLLSYNVRYLFDKTPFWRPWLRLMRMDVRRVGINDYVSKKERDEESPLTKANFSLPHSSFASAPFPASSTSKSTITSSTTISIHDGNVALFTLYLL